MNKLLITIICMLITIGSLISQNVGIGTTSPSRLLHVKNGDTYLDNGKLLFDLFTTQIGKSGGNLLVEVEANLKLKPRSSYDVQIFSGNVEYARFEGTDKRLGLLTSSPQRTLDVNGTTRSNIYEIENQSTKLYKDVSNYFNIENNSHILLNAGEGGGVNDGIFFQDNGISYAKFAKGRLGINNFAPLESIHTNGAMILGGAVGNNPGTMQWTGSDFEGYNGTSWQSLTKINEVMNLTPMSEPNSAVGGDIYMDNGSCNDCGGKIRLRYHNGISWNTI